MPNNRYVILYHKGHGSEHWDLMLDAGRALATWQLAAQPVRGAGEPIPAKPIGDHRKRYLDYEGPIGGDRGSVTRYDRGTYRSVHRTPDCWRLELAGTVLNGLFELVQPDDHRPEAWLFQPVGDIG